MASRITNKSLNTLLSSLGFERSRTTEKKNCVWRHPSTGAEIVLPANKTLESAHQADLISIRARLDYDGHLDVVAFDAFIEGGAVPRAAPRVKNSS